ncbi:2',5'-phosphodiesterase 12, partial [Pseudolycoriella hygida]
VIQVVDGCDNKYVQSYQKYVSIKLVRNGDLVKDFNLMELSSISNDLELFISDEPVAVAYNLPWISSITLPTSILATCYVYPSKIEMQCSNPAETTYVWYKGKPNEKEKNDDAISWTEISHKSPYLVEASDIGYKLKLVCTPRNGSKTGPTADCVSTCTVEAGPGVCLFEQRHLYTQKILPDDMFRVVTYNLLADLYADSDYSRSILFPYCPPYALAIDYRKQLFMKEIAGYNADIICLQEVDGKVFDLDLLPFLQMSNYIGMYKSKGATAEGLATFVNSKKFSLVKNCGINIGENISTLDIFDELWRKIQSNEPLVKRITERSTAVHVTTVKSNDSDKVLVIANTHLYFHPDAAHIRLLQIAFCMKYVESVYHQTKQELNLDENDISIIFCGDFNSVPDGGIFKLMTQRHVEENFVDFQSSK